MSKTRDLPNSGEFPIASRERNRGRLRSTSLARWAGAGLCLGVLAYMTSSGSSAAAPPVALVQKVRPVADVAQLATAKAALLRALPQIQAGKQQELDRHTQALTASFDRVQARLTAAAQRTGFKSGPFNEDARALASAGDASQRDLLLARLRASSVALAGVWQASGVDWNVERGTLISALFVPVTAVAMSTPGTLTLSKGTLGSGGAPPNGTTPGGSQGSNGAQGSGKGPPSNNQTPGGSQGSNGSQGGSGPNPTSGGAQGSNGGQGGSGPPPDLTSGGTQGSNGTQGAGGQYTPGTTAGGGVNGANGTQGSNSSQGSAGTQASTGSTTNLTAPYGLTTSTQGASANSNGVLSMGVLSSLAGSRSVNASAGSLVQVNPGTRHVSVDAYIHASYRDGTDGFSGAGRAESSVKLVALDGTTQLCSQNLSLDEDVCTFGCNNNTSGQGNYHLHCEFDRSQPAYPGTYSVIVGGESDEWAAGSVSSYANQTVNVNSIPSGCLPDTGPSPSGDVDVGDIVVRPTAQE